VLLYLGLRRGRCESCDISLALDRSFSLGEQLLLYVPERCKTIQPPGTNSRTRQEFWLPSAQGIIMAVVTGLDGVGTKTLCALSDVNHSILAMRATGPSSFLTAGRAKVGACRTTKVQRLNSMCPGPARSGRAQDGAAGGRMVKRALSASMMLRTRHPEGLLARRREGLSKAGMS